MHTFGALDSRQESISPNMLRVLRAAKFLFIFAGFLEKGDTFCVSVTFLNARFDTRDFFYMKKHTHMICRTHSRHQTNNIKPFRRNLTRSQNLYKSKNGYPGITRNSVSLFFKIQSFTTARDMLDLVSL